MSGSLSYDPDTGLFYRGVNLIPVPEVNQYQFVWFEGRTMRGHQVAWYLVHRVWSNKRKPIDHINGIKSDNRLCNLRLTTPSVNNHNKVSSGVMVEDRKKPFRGRVIKDGVSNSKSFYEEEEAKAWVQERKSEILQ